MRTILKFDTGADGFKRMMLLLGVLSIVILAVGVYFIIVVLKDLRTIT